MTRSRKCWQVCRHGGGHPTNKPVESGNMKCACGADILLAIACLLACIVMLRPSPAAMLYAVVKTERE